MPNFFFFLIASNWVLDLISHPRHGLGGERLGVAPGLGPKNELIQNFTY